MPAPKRRKNGEQTPPFSREEGLFFLKEMMRIRRLEEKSAELYTKLKIRGFLHLYIGEEAVATGVIPCLNAGDAVLSTYREHGHALVKGMSMGAILAEMYGKAEGCCRGRGGSMHLFDKSIQFYGGNAIVGSHLPVAVGMALADKMQGRKRITCCFFGEGAIAEGEFHESMNLAALWKLPVLFLCENNNYAMGTALHLTESETQLGRKAASYQVENDSADGMDVLQVREAARKAVEWIRAGNGPYFLECRTYRFRPHSMFDAELYRDKAEVEEWKKHDPIQIMVRHMEQAGLLAGGDLAGITQAVEQELEAAVAFAENGSLEPAEDLTRFVYSETTRR